ncbi:toprim domain-containing protein [Campylobacter hyointestinalis]|uniref:toprim domain-containing protein n=1 Tax=Campylobacter hyointestinalis TaxID=198 RepID=UPI000CE52EA3|nr:toprim domain-containing protein [Campylobacter hyointestinalis]PPB57190.1 hypothetical protein CDQ70_07870 [Campylobacter hyointestinalis subsp. hyointestinalis]PPB66477.1 hypothetical protein CDQ76_08825 [Campylobacter hyointestinalis subsp. hyointestinalis]
MRNSKTNLLELPLDEILKNNGYYEKRNKSSRNYKTLTNDQDDTIIISRQANGHYLYFSPNNGSDRGNIYNFAKNRGVSVQNLIDENKINDIKELQNNIKKIINTNKNNNEIIDKFKKFDKIDKNSFLISKRKISSELLANFSSLKQDDKFKNAVVPTYTLGVVETNDGNREFLRQTGTISYLSKPLTQDPQGKAYDKPIKQLCNGAKGLEILKADGAHKSPKDFKNIVICESMIDTLSYCEIKGIDLKETLLCSTNGQISASQKDAIKALQKLAPNAQFVLGFDNDERGKEFGKIVEQIVPNVRSVAPVLKDFNDDLVVGKTLGLKAKDISKESILKPLGELSKQVEYLSKKYDFLEPQAKNIKVKELFVCNISKFREIETKVKCLAGMRECYKRLDIICRKIEKDYSRQR